jgi:hypothetical protein
MGKYHHPEITNENASENPSTLGFVADGGVFRLDAVPSDGKS